MQTFSWNNPKEIDLSQPYLYFIRVKTPNHEYRYVGKGSNKSRMNAYSKNVEKVLSGNPKRPAIKRDGTPQSDGNQKFRRVHLILATAVKCGWEIEHYPVKNVAKSEHSAAETELKLELKCNMNDRETWWVHEFEKLSSELT